MQNNLFSGENLRDIGIKKAIENADEKCESWSQKAYFFLLNYMLDHSEFMVEEVRNASTDIVPEPPSKRAWGGVVIRAVKSGIIKRKGFKNVKNSKAHCTPATLWELVK